MADEDDEGMLAAVQEEIDAGLFEPTDWERDFLEDIEDSIDHLTERQSEKLWQIWEKACH